MEPGNLSTFMKIYFDLVNGKSPRMIGEKSFQH